MPPSDSIFSKLPRNFYFKHGVVSFRIKNKIQFYNVKIWNESGTNLALIKTGKYNGEDPISLIPISINCEDES